MVFALQSWATTLLCSSLYLSLRLGVSLDLYYLKLLFPIACVIQLRQLLFFWAKTFFKNTLFHNCHERAFQSCQVSSAFLLNRSVSIQKPVCHYMVFEILPKNLYFRIECGWDVGKTLYSHRKLVVDICCKAKAKLCAYSERNNQQNHTGAFLYKIQVRSVLFTAVPH